MSREIKYRLIRNGKIVGYERHRLSYVGADKTIIIVIEHSPDGVGFCDFFRRDVKWAWISHDTKEQYTGLKDKNGGEIYEGDVVNWKGMECGDTMAYGKDLIDVVGEIRCEYGSNEWIRNSANQCLVIGNIHANPELMEGK